MNKLFILIFLCFAFTACADNAANNKIFAKKATDNSVMEVNIGGQNLKLLAVQSDAAKAKGLSDRDNVPEDGMIFFFDYPAPLAFWMKDMRFALDMVWINGAEVESITKNAMPQPGAKDKDLKIYSPLLYADTVIELKAGDADKYGIQPGSVFIIRRIEK